MDSDRLYKLLTDIFGKEYEVRSGQFKINCINPNCDDETGNLEISLEKKIFHCWKCSYKGTLRQLLKDYLGWSPNVDEYVSPEDLRKYGSQEFESQEEKVKRVVEFKGLPEDYKYLGAELPSLVGQKALKYTLSRISLDEVKKYRIGYCGIGKYKWRVIIPVFEKGKVFYFVTRSFMTGVLPVYKYPNKEECGTGKNDIVFNIDGARNEGYAVITEGVFDAIRVGEMGVAILGTELSDEQLIKLLDVKKVYVLLDKDAIDKAIKIARRFQSYKVDVRVAVPPKGDPADYSREVIHGWLRDAPPFSLMQEFYSN